jgi:hypothetical protein
LWFATNGRLKNETMIRRSICAAFLLCYAVVTAPASALELEAGADGSLHEFARVSSVSGNTINLVGSLSNGYSASDEDLRAAFGELRIRGECIFAIDTADLENLAFVEPQDAGEVEWTTGGK